MTKDRQNFTCWFEINEDWEIEALRSVLGDEEIGAFLHPDSDSGYKSFNPEIENIKVTLERVPR